MNMKKITLAIAAVLLIGGGAAAENFTYDVQGPASPAEVGELATSYVGFAGTGVLIISWVVFFSIPHRRGYNNLQCAISANFVTTAVSIFIFPMKWIPGEAVVFMFAASGATLAYSRMTRR